MSRGDALKKRSLWKLVGLAGLAGVAATGAVVARAERERRSYTPEQVRSRLHDRVAAMEVGLGTPERPLPGSPSALGRKRRLFRARRRAGA